jgi:hypothetical protein
VQAGGLLTVEGKNSSNRESYLSMVASITGVTISDRRANAVYRVAVSNNSANALTINGLYNGVGTALGGDTNKTSYSTTTIAVGTFWIWTFRPMYFKNGANWFLYNAVDLQQYY